VILEVGKWVIIYSLYRVEILFVMLVATIRWQTPVERRRGTGRRGVGLIVIHLG